MHLFPDLVRLEKKYPNEVVVLGIHSPKFENEKDSKSIEKAMLRYELNHPVINDAEQRIWKAYNVQAWPSVGIIDPEGYLVKAFPAKEHIFNDADRIIAQLRRTHRANGTLNEKPIFFTKAEAEKAASSPLWFPGKVLADGTGRRLFIADSTHHRLVVTDLDGKKLALIGIGKPGHNDGAYDRASFNDPQGLALDGDTLYVADRKNHLIRAVDLKKQMVRTIAGIAGHQGTDIHRGGFALRTGLNSPWDLLVHKGELYIAMAGHHQIWALDLTKRTVVPFAGNGFENLKDGPPAAACFAQPSGLASDGVRLYVADSEVSAIRVMPLDGGPVSTLSGTGLFDFGDVDGVYPKSRLQHPLGVAYAAGKLYVADTYNSKIKVLDPARRSCTTFVGDDKKAKLFNEPGGISYSEGKLYVADTNAHRIQVIDVETKEVGTLKLQGVEPPKP